MPKPVKDQRDPGDPKGPMRFLQEPRYRQGKDNFFAHLDKMVEAKKDTSSSKEED